MLSATATAVGATAVPGVQASTSDWEAVPTPTGNTVFDVETTVDGRYAVAGGGIVLERTAEGWRTLIGGGPTGNGNSLYGADVTDDGEVLWVVGASGAIGAYDVTAGVLDDHSAPMDVTNNFNDVAVTGAAGAANVFVAGDSGKIYYSFENGAPGTWDYVTPGSGSNINAIDYSDPLAGHIVDGNTCVFETADGVTWNRAGIADANYNFYGIDSDGESDVWVVGGGGSIYHWNGSQWVRTDTGDASLRDVEVAGDEGLVVGAGGAIYEYTGTEWVASPSASGANLKAVTRGAVDVAVGAGGVVLERQATRRRR